MTECVWCMCTVYANHLSRNNVLYMSVWMSSAILDPHQFASCLIEYRCIFVCCVCCAVDAGHINNDAGWCLVTLHHQSFPLGIGHIRSDGQCLSFSISRKRVTDKICCRNEWRRPFQKGGIVERMWDAAGWRGRIKWFIAEPCLKAFHPDDDDDNTSSYITRLVCWMELFVFVKWAMQKCVLLL